MSSFQWRLLVTVLAYFCSMGLTYGHELCPPSINCDCFLGTYNTELQCPKYVGSVGITIITGEKVDVECVTEDILDPDIIPNFDAHRERKFVLKYCNFNSTFEDIFRKFQMTKVERIVFEQMGVQTTEYLNVSKELLRGLSDLSFLSLTFSKPVFETDFLKNVTKLRSLYLNSNQITSINWTFEHVPDLEHLDVSRNQIENLTDGTFKDLKNLNVLHLWGNQIQSLRRKVFTGLENLNLVELYSNQVTNLPEDTFYDLVNVENIGLRANKIEHVHGKTFRNNHLLQNVRLDFNKIQTLEDYLFSNFSNLNSVELNDNKLQSIPEHTFTNSTSLVEIKLQNNKLETLPEKLFDGLKNLLKLDLSSNSLKSLSNDVFSSLEKLNELYLGSNLLEEISDVVFGKLKSLDTLNLSKNRIVTIEILAFSQTPLVFLDLSYNMWNNSYLEGFGSPLGECVKAKELILHHNNITEAIEIHSLISLTLLDLSYNDITKVPIDLYASGVDIVVNFTHNKIKTVGNFIEAKYIVKWNLEENQSPLGQAVIDVNDNPISCDCANYELIKYNNLEYPNLTQAIDIKQENLYCPNSHSLKIEDIKPWNIYCSTDSCSDICSCSYQPYYKAVMVDCSYRNLTQYPDFNLNLITSDTYQQTVLNLTGNQLTAGPRDDVNYQNVTRLDLSRNRINNISWIPPKIKELNLQGNKLTVLDHEIVDVLNKTSSIEKLILKDNPWVCDCKLFDLQKYLMQNYKKVQTADVFCHNTNTLLEKTFDLCKTSRYLTIMLPIALSMLLAFAVMAAIYYRYQTEIKIYLYAKNLCLWFVTEEELDKDKTYDVFVSYSQEDEKFVVEHLVPELESGEHPFKVCIHIRDWIPGDMIAEQIVRSVNESRRTLVVLSNNFLKSVWGKMEFRTAHTQAMSEGRARVIVVILGDLDEEKIDDELKSYLKTNTYVKWGDRYFWNKLKYAMPHSRNGFYARNRKMMLKIDDKFILVPPSPTKTSTPPITLNPSLLEKSEIKLDIPRNFDEVNPDSVKLTIH